MGLIIKNTKLDSPEPIKVAVYGRHKVGKTTFAGTFPNPFFFTVGNETGISSLTQLEASCDYAVINGIEDMQAALRYWKENYKAKGYRTAVVDTVTVYGRMVSNQLSDYGRIKMEHQGWAQVLSHLLNIRDVLHSSDAHVVWVFHADEVRGGGDVVIGTRPKLVGQALNEILQTVGLIAYLDKFETQESTDTDGVVQPAQTIRRLWTKCPASMTPQFEVGSWYDQVLTAPCYAPDFKVLARFLAPENGKKHITV